MKADTNTPEFKRWFGKSKVVDSWDRPMPVYHGTSRGGFTEFKYPSNKRKIGFFFTNSPDLASTYAGGWNPQVLPTDKEEKNVTGIYRVFLKLENPLIVDADGADWDRIRYRKERYSTDQLALLARKEGYDGLIVRDVADSQTSDDIADVFVAFEPTQIKSATNNRGTFDPHDPDIRNPSLSPNQQRKYLAGLTGTERKAREAEILYRREHRSNEPFATDVGQTTQRSSHAAKFERKYGRAAADTADVAKLTGVPKKILDEVYARGMAAWQTGHRPGASQHAWALARVYSFVTGGPTMRGPDADLAREAGMTRNPADTFIPPAAVAAEARRALELRSSQPPSNRCCTPVGIRRASQLANRQPVSVDTLRRMKAYFDRHAIDKQGKGWAEGTSKGLQAWLAWGGDSARVWCNEVLASLDGARHNPRGFSQKGDAMAGKTKNPLWFISMPDGTEKRASTPYEAQYWTAKGGKSKKAKREDLIRVANEHMTAGAEAQAAGDFLRWRDHVSAAYSLAKEAKADLFLNRILPVLEAARAATAKKNPAKSKKRNPSAAEHAKRGQTLLDRADDLFHSGTKADNKFAKRDLVHAVGEAARAYQDFKDANETSHAKSALELFTEAGKELTKGLGTLGLQRADWSKPERNPAKKRNPQMDVKQYRMWQERAAKMPISALLYSWNDADEAEKLAASGGDYDSASKYGRQKDIFSEELRLRKWYSGVGKPPSPESRVPYLGKPEFEQGRVKNPKSKTKKRNPSADVHAKHYAELMQDGIDARKDAEDRESARGKNDASRAMYALALERAYAAGREAKYAGMDKRYAEGAEVLEDTAMRGIMRNPGKRLHNFKVLDAKGKAIALTTTLPEANKVCPKGGKVVAL